MPHLNLANFGVNANFRVAPNVLGNNPQLKNASKQSVQNDPNVETVGTTSVLYNSMATKWPLIEDLWGGTMTMRRGERQWLPIEPKEEEQMYRNRLDRSILFNAFRATIDRLVSKPFSHAVTISEISGPDKLLSIEDDVDGTGKNLTQFSRELFESGLKYGLSHTLIDFTRISDNVETKKDEDSIGTRPFFIHVEPTQLIFWDIQNDPITQVPTLNEIRIRELSIEKVGKFSDKLIETIRVFKKSAWEVWTFNTEAEEYQKTDGGDNSLGIIPLVTFYVRRTGPLTGTPPFEDLAWLNLAHWQSYSDQRNILRFARTGILFGAGFREDEFSGVAWGPNTFIKSTDPETKLTTVEYEGDCHLLHRDESREARADPIPPQHITLDRRLRGNDFRVAGLYPSAHIEDPYTHHRNRPVASVRNGPARRYWAHWLQPHQLAGLLWERVITTDRD